MNSGPDWVLFWPPRGRRLALGNIWGFPTQAASNGGAAFLITYLVLAFVLAYPALMAELLIGRHTHRNMVTALESLPEGEPLRSLGRFTGIGGLVTASLILSFYAIVAGWMLGFAASYPLKAIGMTHTAEWLITFDLPAMRYSCWSSWASQLLWSWAA